MLEKEDSEKIIENKTITVKKASHAILCRTYCGGKDLFYGIPDLEGAVVTAVTPHDSEDDYITIIELRTKNNDMVTIQIRQDRI